MASANYLSGTLTTGTQPNITSLGTQVNGLNLASSQTYKINNINVLSSTALGSSVTSSSLTSLGTQVSNLNMGTKNIINVGSITTTDLTATDLTATNLTVTNLGGTLTTNSQPNITSLGTLSNLFVNSSLNLGAYTANVPNKGIFFRANGGATFQEGGSNLFNLSITTWDNSTNGATPDALSINAYDGIRFVTQSSSTAYRIPLIVSSDGNTNITNLSTAELTVSNSLNCVQSPKVILNYNGSTSTVLFSYGVSSVVRTGVGRYTINFTTAFSSINYSWYASAGHSSLDQANYVSNDWNTNKTAWKTTSSIKLQCYYSNADNTNVDVADFNVVIYGNV